MLRGRKLGKDSITILTSLLDIGSAALNDLYQMPYKHKMPWNYRGFFLKLYNLERHGYVQKRKKNNQSFFRLTPKGKLRILKYIQLERLKAKKWDEQWRVIIFDIPNSLKKWREYLRRELKGLGFYPLQESVYITPYPMTGALDNLLKEWNLRKYFRYLTVSEIDDEEECKQIFGMK